MSFDRSPRDQYAGNWKWNTSGDDTAVALTLDIGGLIHKMTAVEEKVTRQLVIAKLRELGYTVIEPVSVGSEQ